VTQRANWQESDLLALIRAGEKESLTLEYKACEALGASDGKKNEVSKDVSALANSAGGTIIYGMLEDGHVPTGLDVGYDRGALSKEWLEQVITSRIQRRIDGVVIHEVELETTNAGRVAYVVSIPQSLRAPHQASDKRFYKRFNFQSVPMEEYEVRDVSRRSEAPDLTMQFFAEPAGAEAVPGQPPHAQHVAITASVSNLSSAPASHAVVRILLDKRLTCLDRPTGLNANGELSLSIGQSPYPCSCWQLNHSVPGNLPIFEGIEFNLFDRPIKVRVENDGLYAVGCQLLAPGMAHKVVGALMLCQGEHVVMLPNQ
jgi:Putative DNA-binding domain